MPHYGYLWADEQHTAYIPDPETVPVIVRIWRRIADGVSIRAVAHELDADGIPTPAQLLRQRGLLPAARPDPTDKGWHPGSIARMLRHPAYVGQHAAYRFAVSATKERSHATGVTHKVTRMRERALDDPDRVALPPKTCPALIEPELAARVHAQLALNKANSAGNNPDPLATLFRGMTYCGHCGDKMGTSKSAGAHGGDGWLQRRCYRCNSARVPGRTPCPGGMHSLAASVLDPAAWADIVEWLSNPKNVARLMDEWQQQHAQSSITSRLDAVNAQLTHLRERMAALAEAISETSVRESRAVLQEKLDELSAQVTREQGKREQLLRDAQQERDRARDARDICAWAAEVSERAGEFTREAQIDTLRALGARVEVWRNDYKHPDGWPQRYRITLNFTGFSGQPVTLPASYRVSHIKMLT